MKNNRLFTILAVIAVFSLLTSFCYAASIEDYKKQTENILKKYGKDKTMKDLGNDVNQFQSEFTGMVSTSFFDMGTNSKFANIKDDLTALNQEQNAIGTKILGRYFDEGTTVEEVAKEFADWFGFKLGVSILLWVIVALFCIYIIFGQIIPRIRGEKPEWKWPWLLRRRRGKELEDLKKTHEKGKQAAITLEKLEELEASLVRSFKDTELEKQLIHFINSVKMLVTRDERDPAFWITNWLIGGKETSEMSGLPNKKILFRDLIAAIKSRKGTIEMMSKYDKSLEKMFANEEAKLKNAEFTHMPPEDKAKIERAIANKDKIKNYFDMWVHRINKQKLSLDAIGEEFTQVAKMDNQKKIPKDIEARFKKLTEGAREHLTEENTHRTHEKELYSVILKLITEEKRETRIPIGSEKENPINLPKI